MDVLRSVVVCVLCILGACNDNLDRDKGLFGQDEQTDGERDEEDAAIDADIEALADWKQIDDPDAAVAYDDARRRLEMRGTAVQPQLIAALATSDDWGIRYGAIEVLDSIGTRDCIDVLIDTLDDQRPAVAYKAMMSLRVICDHREIPTEGVAENGLSAVPEPPADSLERHVRHRLWKAWHQEHAVALERAWKRWWEANRRELVIE